MRFTHHVRVNPATGLPAPPDDHEVDLDLSDADPAEEEGLPALVSEPLDLPVPSDSTTDGHPLSAEDGFGTMLTLPSPATSVDEDFLQWLLDDDLPLSPPRLPSPPPRNPQADLYRIVDDKSILQNLCIWQIQVIRITCISIT